MLKWIKVLDLEGNCRQVNLSAMSDVRMVTEQIMKIHVQLRAYSTCGTRYFVLFEGDSDEVALAERNLWRWHFDPYGAECIDARNRDRWLEPDPV